MHELMIIVHEKFRYNNFLPIYKIFFLFEILNNVLYSFQANSMHE